MSEGRLSLLPWSLFAGMIAAAGLPIYINAPKFYVDAYGVSLTALGLVLFGLRLVDVVQDPFFGWIAERARRRRGAIVAGAAALMATAMLALFAVPPPVPALWWFGISLTSLFSGYSMLTICFYAQGVEKARHLEGSHLRLAGWREAGGLIGICIAAVAPTGLALLTGRPFAAFAVGFAVLTAVAVFAMRGAWGTRDRADAGGAGPAPSAFEILRDPAARALLLLALVNAAPVAVTSNLFLFFVDSRLRAAAWQGPLLLLFFIAAAITAPGWSRLADRVGARRTLLWGMGLAILAFGFALTLGTGDVGAFAVISAASGAALAADMVLLPAIFARSLASREGGEAMGFGLWSFASKLTLALAAGTLFPLLQWYGYRADGTNGPEALTALTVLYAGVPCVLKVVAIGLLLRMPDDAPAPGPTVAPGGSRP